jgi:hypothetical protein
MPSRPAAAAAADVELAQDRAAAIVDRPGRAEQPLGDLPVAAPAYARSAVPQRRPRG